mmetsp:Transcript_10803/g.35796  ORF Transcript_10803/g.35796 Transcript_10803/m.35796 type:complete len:444 (+) Transcript_10803:89-1420(+)
MGILLCFFRLSVFWHNTPRSEALASRAGKVRALNEWLGSKLVKFERVEVAETSSSSSGWGLVATKALRRGDVALEVPESLCLVGEDPSEIAAQFVGLEANVWTECCVEANPAATLPLLSSDGALAGYSSRDFEALRDNARIDAAELGVDFEGRYRPALAIALSRSFFVEGRFVLAPGLDFANHDDLLDPVADGPDLRISRRNMIRGGKKFVFECSEDVDEGQPVSLSYGPLSAATYVENYGFLPSRGAARRASATAELRFDLDNNDRWIDDKTDVLRRNGFLAVDDDENQENEEPPSLQIAVGGEPDPDYFRFQRLNHLGGTDAFLLEPLFSNEIWDFLGLPVSKDNELACLETLRAECLATADTLTATPHTDDPLGALLGQVQTIERNALKATLDWIQRDVDDLDSKEYYQQRRLKDLGLDTAWSADEAQWSGSRTPGGVDW